MISLNTYIMSTFYTFYKTCSTIPLPYPLCNSSFQKKIQVSAQLKNKRGSHLNRAKDYYAPRLGENRISEEKFNTKACLPFPVFLSKSSLFLYFMHRYIFFCWWGARSGKRKKRQRQSTWKSAPSFMKFRRETGNKEIVCKKGEKETTSNQFPILLDFLHRDRNNNQVWKSSFHYAALRVEKKISYTT